MEWVETVGSTIEEARDAALDLLGVAEDEAEFEILDEPKPGLFGRTRGTARVRARVRPTQPRPKLDRRGRRVRSSGAPGDDATVSDGAPEDDGEASDQVDITAPGRVKRRGGGRRAGSARVVSAVEDSAGERVIESNRRPRGQTHTATSAQAVGARSGEGASAESDGEQMTRGGEGETMDSREMDTVSAHEVADAAAAFLKGLVEALGLEGDVTAQISGDEIDIDVAGDQLGLLVGPRGATLVAVQELTRLASQRRLGDQQTRLRVDVAGYRERRRVALSAFANKMADEVVESGVARVLEPMSSPDRKVVHDTLNDRSDVATRSEGDDPYRRVVISPVE